MTDEKPSLEMPEHPFSNDQPQSHSPHHMVETTQMAQSSLEAIATDAYLAANLDPNFSQLSRNEYAGNGPVLAPRPVNPDVSQQMSNSNHMGPTSIMQSNPIMGVGHNGTEQIGTKSRRLNRACDACSKRKIKCDQDRPCKNCRDLELDCTQKRPSRRRGPVNRVAEEMKRNSNKMPASEPEGSPFENGISQQVTSCESIATVDQVQALADLYFSTLYPLYPFPHMPTFRTNLLARYDTFDTIFTSLIASMIGALAMAHPSEAARILGQPVEQIVSFVDRCANIALRCRGLDSQLRAEYTLFDAMTSFFLGLIGLRANKLAQFRLFMSECHGMLDTSLIDPEENPMAPGVVELEIGHRIRMAIYSEMQCLMRTDSKFRKYISPGTENMPATLPTEVDDDYLHHDRVDMDLVNGASLIHGTNLIARLYDASSVTKLDLATDEYKTVIKNCLNECNSLCESAPQEIKTAQEQIDMPDVDVRLKQYNSQRIMLSLTALACRTHLLLLLQQTDESDPSAADELSAIVRDLAAFLRPLRLPHLDGQAAAAITRLDYIVKNAVSQVGDSDAAFCIVKREELRMAYGMMSTSSAVSNMSAVLNVLGTSAVQPSESSNEAVTAAAENDMITDAPQQFE